MHAYIYVCISENEKSSKYINQNVVHAKIKTVMKFARKNLKSCVSFIQYGLIWGGGL